MGIWHGAWVASMWTWCEPVQYAPAGLAELRLLQDLEPAAAVHVADHAALIELLGANDLTSVWRSYGQAVEAGTRSRERVWDSIWTKSLAVAQPEYEEDFRVKQGSRRLYRKMFDLGATRYSVRPSLPICIADFCRRDCCSKRPTRRPHRGIF